MRHYLWFTQPMLLFSITPIVLIYDVLKLICLIFIHMFFCYKVHTTLHLFQYDPYLSTRVVYDI